MKKKVLFFFKNLLKRLHSSVDQNKNDFNATLIVYCVRINLHPIDWSLATICHTLQRTLARRSKKPQQPHYRRASCAYLQQQIVATLSAKLHTTRIAVLCHSSSVCLLLHRCCILCRKDANIGNSVHTKPQEMTRMTRNYRQMSSIKAMCCWLT